MSTDGAPDFQPECSSSRLAVGSPFPPFLQEKGRVERNLKELQICSSNCTDCPFILIFKLNHERGLGTMHTGRLCRWHRLGLL